MMPGIKGIQYLQQMGGEASSPAVLLQSAIREGNWADLTFVKTSGTVARDREKKLTNS